MAGARSRRIWEVRGEPRHFLYSKVMCWVALDRAISLADRIGASDRTGQWKAARDEIAETVLQQGWNEEIGAFTQYVGGSQLDASNLMMAIVGFLPATDARMKATIDATAAQLTDERGLVFRYLTARATTTSMAWPVKRGHSCCVRSGSRRRKRWQARCSRHANIERAVSFANDVGLLAEEVDGRTGELLGNFPQAFSHIGLINAAWAIAQVEQQ